MSKHPFQAFANYVATMAFLLLAYAFYLGSERFAHLFS